MVMSDGQGRQVFLVDETVCAGALGAGCCLALPFVQGTEERQRFLDYGAKWDICGRRCVHHFQTQWKGAWVAFMGMPWQNSIWLLCGREEKSREDPLLLI